MMNPLTKSLIIRTKGIIPRPTAEAISRSLSDVRWTHWVGEYKVSKISIGQTHPSESDERKDSESIDYFAKMYKNSPDNVPPPVVQPDPEGKLIVVEGHHRRLAAIRAGLSEIYFIVINY